MLSYLVPLLVAILVWLGLRLTGHETHTADGILFFGLVAVEVLVVVRNTRKPKPPTSAYSVALPALLFVPAASTPVLLWAIGLLALAYVAKAACDNLTHQAGNSIFEKWGAWFDARTSWLLKYKPGSWPATPKARFWLSTTALVWLTDFWHAADSVYLTAYLLGGMLLGAWLGPVQALPWVLAVVAVKAGGGGVFQACYRWFRITQSNSQ